MIKNVIQKCRTQFKMLFDRYAFLYEYEEMYFTTIINNLSKKITFILLTVYLRCPF